MAHSLQYDRMNVQRFYETLAAIVSEREGVKITVTVKRKDRSAAGNEIKEKPPVTLSPAAMP